MEAKLLIVDDKESVRASLQDYFVREGFSVAIAEDGAQALRMLDEVHPDLVILDVHMPHKDGLEVCQAIRSRRGSSTGIVMISGMKKEWVDRVVGLELGADAYLTKPFETRELLAQVRAVLRRYSNPPAGGEAAGWLVVDDYLRIHFERRQVEVAGQEVYLTSLEFDLLEYLAKRPGVPRARGDIIDNVWGFDEAAWDTSDSAVNTCVARLRAKIEPDASNPRYILSLHGVGYRFKAL
jgi:two-component system response regulator RegX3